MDAMNGHITDILYNAAAARHAFTLLVNLRRAYKNAPENERAILTQLHDSGAYEEAMSGLDWAEKAHYESIVDEINGLINVMPINAMTAAN